MMKPNHSVLYYRFAFNGLKSRAEDCRDSVELKDTYVADYSETGSTLSADMVAEQIYLVVDFPARFYRNIPWLKI